VSLAPKKGHEGHDAQLAAPPAADTVHQSDVFAQPLQSTLDVHALFPTSEVICSGRALQRSGCTFKPFAAGQAA
jgi:hypothetical protein